MALHTAPALVASLLIALTILVVSSAAAQGADTRIVIVSPQNEETIHDNSGLVPVTVAVEHDALTRGRALRVVLDGMPSGSEQRPGSFVLQGVERGTHTLEAQLVDRGGKVVARSVTVTFHLWQASALFPGRVKKP